MEVSNERNDLLRIELTFIFFSYPEGYEVEDWELDAKARKIAFRRLLDDAFNQFEQTIEEHRGNNKFVRYTNHITKRQYIEEMSRHADENQ